MSRNESLGFIINNTARKITLYLTSLFQAYNVTPEQWYVLNRLAEADGISQRELSRRVDKDPANLTRIVDQLERRGLVRREANSSDRRAFRLRVTEDGARLDAVLAPMEAQAMRDLLAGIAHPDFEAALSVLAVVGRNADKRIGSARRKPD